MECSQEIANLCTQRADAVVTARSASAAFLGLLLALDVEPDAEVILPVSICQTMINAVLFAGAVPVLADSGYHFELASLSLADRLSSRTRVVVFHHPFGRACDAAAVRRVLANRPDVFLLEDCAQSPGTASNGRIVGTTGDAALFSFGVGKPIDASGGGAVVVGRPHLAERVEAALRVGRRGWGDDVVLGIDSALTAAEARRVTRAIAAYKRSAGRRIEKVQRVFGAGRADSGVGDHPQNVYHRLVLDLGEAPCVSPDRRTDRDRDLWQAVSPPTPPYAVPFLRRRYLASGRPDLWDPLGRAFPMWHARAKQCVLVRTDASVTVRRLSAFCRSLGLGA
jgi:hypothetical protein